MFRWSQRWKKAKTTCETIRRITWDYAWINASTSVKPLGVKIKIFPLRSMRGEKKSQPAHAIQRPEQIKRDTFLTHCFLSIKLSLTLSTLIRNSSTALCSLCQFVWSVFAVSWDFFCLGCCKPSSVLMWYETHFGDYVLAVFFLWSRSEGWKRIIKIDFHLINRNWWTYTFFWLILLPFSSLLFSSTQLNSTWLESTKRRVAKQSASKWVINREESWIKLKLE